MTAPEDPPDDEQAPKTEPDENVVRVDFRRGARVQDTAGPEAADKLRAFKELVVSGMVMVTLDARRPGVSVPSRFAKDGQLNLNFSHRFGVPDFVYDERGVRSTLTFGGHPFFCDVPWGAVWGLRSHVDNPDHVTVFHDALPEELLAMLPPAARQQLGRAQERREAAKDGAKDGAKDSAKDSGKETVKDGGLRALGPPVDPGDGIERVRGGLRLVRPVPQSSSDDSNESDTIPDRTEEP